MVFREIIYACSEKDNKAKTIPSGKNKEIMNGKTGCILYRFGLRALVVFSTSLAFVEFAKQAARLMIAGL
jgi:hypothetical protein